MAIHTSCGLVKHTAPSMRYRMPFFQLSIHKMACHTRIKHVWSSLKHKDTIRIKKIYCVIMVIEWNFF